MSSGRRLIVPILSLVLLSSSFATAQDYRRTYNPPGYIPPNYTPSSSTDPAYTPPSTNPSPTTGGRSDTAQDNKGLGTARSATTALQRRIGSEIEDRLLDYLETFEAELKQALFTDLSRDELLEKIEKDENIDQNDKAIQQLDEALIDLDSLAVNRACKKLGVPEAEIAELLVRVEITGSFNSLKKKISDGESALGVGRVIRSLRQDLKEVKLSRTKVASLVELSELIGAGARIRDAVEGGGLGALSARKTVEWPIGEVPTVFYPRIPRGQVFVLGDDCLVAGAAAGADIEFAVKSVAEAMILPVYHGAIPVPNVDEECKPKTGVVIRNPDDSGVTLNYQLYYQPDYGRRPPLGNWKIAPGESKPHPEKKTYVISFSRGEKWKQLQANTLQDGCYQFVTGPDSGWQIQADQYRMTIDNSDNPNDFYYVVDGRAALVAAGRSNPHSSNYPIVIRFERGGGKQYLTKAYKKSGPESHWKVGVNIENNFWDLYDQEDIPVVTE